VNEIRSDVVQQPLIVRNQNHGLVRIVKLIDAFGTFSASISRPESVVRTDSLGYGRLENLVALFSPPEKPLTERS
jgi:hypothetical protein